MILPVDTLDEALDGIEAIVVDQWGVLHDGSTPYPYAMETLRRLKAGGYRLAILSNSGRRAAANEETVTRMGFPAGLFDCVMTSGEALWRDFAVGRMPFSKLVEISRAAGDAEEWAAGLDVALTDASQAEAVLLMGWPENAPEDLHADIFETALARKLPLLCSNPDRGAPRKGGSTVLSPGALAATHARRGGDVRFVGKPFAQVFHAVEATLALPASKLLMVGDSLEHDIAGAHAAGWRSAFIRAGLHAARFDPGDIVETTRALAREIGSPLPDYTLEYLR